MHDMRMMVYATCVETMKSNYYVYAKKKKFQQIISSLRNQRI